MKQHKDILSGGAEPPATQNVSDPEPHSTVSHPQGINLEVPGEAGSAGATHPWSIAQTGCSRGPCHSPVALVQLDDLVFQFFRVVWGKAELADVVAATLVRVVVAQFRLDGVGAQQGQRDEGAGQPAGHDVVAQLQAEVVPSGGQRAGRRSVRRLGRSPRSPQWAASNLSLQNDPLGYTVQHLYLDLHTKGKYTWPQNVIFQGI